METKTKYTLEKNVKFNNIITVLLNEMINNHNYIPVKLTGDNGLLEDAVSYMSYNGLVRVNGSNYVPTDKGRDMLKKFYDKFYEFLRLFDVFSSVDMESGEFGFAKYYDFDTDEEFRDYINQERFEDMRVAVCEFKKIDPLEVIFMSFLNDGKFETRDQDGREIKGWQKVLTGDDTWNSIISICNSKLHADEYMEDGIMENLVKKGTELMLSLMKQEEEYNKRKDQDDQGEDDVVEETTVVEETYVDYVEPPLYTYDYFYPYMDPFYVSPVWALELALIY